MIFFRYDFLDMSFFVKMLSNVVFFEVYLRLISARWLYKEL